MAALGGVVQHYVKFPGFESVPAGMDAVTTAPGTYGFIALFLLSGEESPKPVLIDPAFSRTVLHSFPFFCTWRCDGVGRVDGRSQQGAWQLWRSFGSWTVR